VLNKLLNDTSDAHKLLAVRACLALIVEGSRLPWYPPVADLRRDLAGTIRAILKVSSLDDSPLIEPRLW
jgi:neurofibromin 1